MQMRLPFELDGSGAAHVDRAINEAADKNEGLSVSKNLVGSWCGGERFVIRDEQLVPANVWFHFRDEGRISVSVRCRSERQPSVATGTWRLEGQVLSVIVGNREVQAEVSLKDGVVHWAGEILVRMPEGLDHPLPF
jgi:hypothetical protein